MSKKEYKSLGEMIKKGDFQSFINEFNEMKENKELKDLMVGEITKLDELLFLTPKYLTKKVDFEDENTGKKTKIDNGELHPYALEALHLMLDNGANPNAYMKNGENTFLKLCQLTTVEPLKSLLSRESNKIDIHHEDGIGNNALFYATVSESLNCIEYLVKELKFDVNRKNFLNNDQTALHYACGFAKEKSVDKLLELGASPTIKDAYGFTPLKTMTPAYLEDVRQEFDEVPEELAVYDKLYAKMEKITNDYKEKNPIKRKVKF